MPTKVSLDKFRLGTKVPIINAFKLCIIGAPGSGKTTTAMHMAYNISLRYPGKKVLFLDSENGASVKSLDDGMAGAFDIIGTMEWGYKDYCDFFDYVVSKPEEYSEYCCIVLDNASDHWSKARAMVDKLATDFAKNGKDDDTAAWKVVSPNNDKFFASISKMPIHLIMTVQAKQAMEIVKKVKDEDTGKWVDPRLQTASLTAKQQLKSMGVVSDPQCKPGFVQWFDLAFVAHDGGEVGIVTKTRYKLGALNAYSDDLLAFGAQFCCWPGEAGDGDRFVDAYFEWLEYLKTRAEGVNNASVQS
jgi:hypothetical protein